MLSSNRKVLDAAFAAGGDGAAGIARDAKFRSAAGAAKANIEVLLFDSFHQRRSSAAVSSTRVVSSTSSLWSSPWCLK